MVNEQDLININNRLTKLERRLLKAEGLILNTRSERISFKIRKKWDTFFSSINAIVQTSEHGVTFVDRIKLLSITMYRWARSGFKLEEKQVQIARFEICRSCPELNQETFQCNMCGCFMKNKVKIAEASCPLKKC